MAAPNQSVLQRLESAQMNVANHEKEMGQFREAVRRDLAHLAAVLGTDLPSQLPQVVNTYEDVDAIPPPSKRSYY
jgi:hypothetical protein